MKIHDKTYKTGILKEYLSIKTTIYYQRNHKIVHKNREKSLKKGRRRILS